jgi:hypothetical protein
MQKMELENAKLKEAHMTIAEKMGKQNASWKEAKITNGGKIERANATWKGAHLTNEEYMERTNASWKEATWYVENIGRWNATREKGKCQMQHTWKQQISLDKGVKPAQKTKETLNLKREVRGEPVKPKKNAQCWGSRLLSGQATSRKGRSLIRIGDLQNWTRFEKNHKKWCKKKHEKQKKHLKHK